MEKSFSKILTLSFALFGAITAIALSLLLKSLAGAFASLSIMMGYDWFRHGLPVVVGFIVFLSLQFHPRALGWGYEVLTELSRVVWPPRKDVLVMTWAVLVMVIFMALVIALFDVIAAAIMNLVVS
jgi:preprotein translocase subunit SecE